MNRGRLDSNGNIALNVSEIRRTVSADELNITRCFDSFDDTECVSVDGRSISPARSFVNLMQNRTLNNQSLSLDAEIMPLNYYRSGSRRRGEYERPACFSPVPAIRPPPPPGEDLFVVDGNMRCIGGRNMLGDNHIVTSTPLESPASSARVKTYAAKLPVSANSRIFSESFISAIATGTEAEQRQREELFAGDDYQQQFQRLNRLLQIQDDQIDQASSALSQCRKQHRSNGTLAELTAQRALLLATERRRVLQVELERLNAQHIVTTGSLPPRTPSLRGSMTISTIRIYLNRNFCLKSIDKETSYDFVVLLRSGQTVYATQMASVMDIGALRARTVRFPDSMRFNNLAVDFTVRIEIYALKIENRASQSKAMCAFSPRRAFNCLNPLSKRHSKISNQSAVNSNEFCRCGNVNLNARTTGSLKLYVDDAEYPLEGTIELRAECSMMSSSSEIEYHGFLSMYETIGVENTWTRYWAVLQQGVIKFWRYPEDEIAEKPAHAYIDMSKVTNDYIITCPPEICSRSHTFYIDLFVQSNSMARSPKPIYSLKRVLLNADNKLLCEAWIEEINKTLHLVRGGLDL